MLTGLALLAIPAFALAGKTATDGTDTLKIKTKIAPAKASKKKGNARAVEVTFEYLAGTTDGSRLPDVRSVSAYFGGVVTNYDAFPKCSETKASKEGDEACPPGSLVGAGKATAEVHPPDSATSKVDVPVDVEVFNGILTTDENGELLGTPKDGLLFYTEVAGTNVALPFWAEDGNRRVTYYNPDEDGDPPADNAPYTIKRVELVFDKRSVKKGEKRIPFMQAPKKCRKSWKTTATNDRYAGGELTATHKVRCRKAGS